MVSMDAFASAFGFDAKSDDVWTTLGKVTAVGSGTLSVLLGGSATPTECEAYCLASVGDVVFVAITKGRARAIACKGVDAATWRTALGLGSMATEDSSDYLPVSGGTLTGSLTLNNSSVSISHPDTWRSALCVGSWGQMYDTTGQITLSTSWQKIPMTNFEGVGTSALSNGIKVTNAGIYVISGQFRVSNGFTANDLVHVGLFVNDYVKAEGCRRMITTSDWGTVETVPHILQLAVNDVVSIRARNEGGARGYVPKGYPENTYLSVKQIA